MKTNYGSKALLFGASLLLATAAFAGEKATVKTPSGCSSLWSSLPLDTSQSHTTLSSSPKSGTEASILWSGEKIGERIDSPCP